MPASRPERHERLALVRYRWDPANRERVEAVYPRHRAHLDVLGRAGELLLIGPVGDPDAGEIVAVFRSEEAARRFVAVDPLLALAHVEAVTAWSPLDYTRDR